MNYESRGTIKVIIETVAPWELKNDCNLPVVLFLGFLLNRRQD